MSEGAKTLVFVTVAVGLAIVAVLTQPAAPRPAELAREGDLLNEVDNPLSAARLEIVKFDEDTASVKDFAVALVDGMWVIPSHQNYPADAERQMAEAATSVMNRKILGVVSSNPGDHETFGVVDPDVEKLQPGAQGVGTRVVMQNAANKQLVHMIIGKEVKDESGQRYVREVGRDPVYQVTLDPSKLTTRFEDWIEDDLLKLNPFDIAEIVLKDYSVELGLGAGGLSILWDRRNEMGFAYDNSESKWTAKEMKVFDKQKDQFETVTLAANEEVNSDKLNDLKTALDDLRIVDVERKPEGLSRDLKAEKDFATNREAVQNLAARGFMPVQTSQDSFDILSTDGEVLCQMKDGVEYVLRFGKLVLGSESTPAKKEEKQQEQDKSDAGADQEAGQTDDEAEESSTGINRYIFVTARLNEDVIERPELEELPELPEGQAAETGAEDKDQKADDQSEAAAKDETATEAERDKAATEQPPQQPASTDADSAPAETGVADSQAADEQAAPADNKDSAEPGDDSAQEQAAPADDKDSAEPGDESTDQPPATPAADESEADASEPETTEQSPPQDTDKEDETLEDLIEKRKEIEKENQQKLDDYNDKIKKGKERVTELNQRFGDWYYVISDSVFKKIHLGRDDVVKEKEKEEEEEKKKKDEEEKDATKAAAEGSEQPDAQSPPTDQLEDAQEAEDKAAAPAEEGPKPDQPGTEGKQADGDQQAAAEQIAEP